MSAEISRWWKLAGCLMVMFYGTILTGAEAASGNNCSTSGASTVCDGGTKSGGSADLSRLRLKRSEELVNNKETVIQMRGVIPMHACCPTGIEMPESAGDSKSYAVLGGLGSRLINHLGSPTICTVLVCHGTCEFMFGPPCKLISSAKAISNVILDGTCGRTHNALVSKDK